MTSTAKSQAQNEFISNPKGFLSSLTTTEKRFLAELITLDNKCKYLYPSQANWADRAGARRETANRKRKKFELSDIIQTRQLSGRHATLNYYINPKLHDREVRKELATIPAFKECFSAPTIWWLIPPTRTFVKKSFLDKQDLITPINRTCSIRNPYQLNRPLSREEESRLQCEMLKSKLTSEQRAQLDSYRSGNYGPPRVRSGLVTLTPEQVRDWKPETIGDLLRKKGMNIEEEV